MPIFTSPTAAANMLGHATVYDRVPYVYSDQYDWGMEYSGFVPGGTADDVIIRGDLRTGTFIASWMIDGRVKAGINVNTWDVTGAVQALAHSDRAIDAHALADPDQPLESVVPNDEPTDVRRSTSSVARTLAGCTTRIKQTGPHPGTSCRRSPSPDWRIVRPDGGPSIHQATNGRGRATLVKNGLGAPGHDTAASGLFVLEAHDRDRSDDERQRHRYKKAEADAVSLALSPHANEQGPDDVRDKGD
jgi:hypothetical protein